MTWFRRNKSTRALELNTKAFLVWQRRSKDERHRLTVGLKDGEYIVYREGKAAAPPMYTTREVEAFIRRYFDNLLYNGSGAPDDVFLDSMQSVTRKGKA
jgi:hypothetical protein